jgi:hypothetical protein
MNILHVAIFCPNWSPEQWDSTIRDFSMLCQKSTSKLKKIQNPGKVIFAFGIENI